MATNTGLPWSLPYPESTDDVRPYEDIQALAVQVHAMLDTLLNPTWTAYTPSLSASGGGLSLGNGAIVGEYQTRGNLVFANWQLTVGSTTNLGSGALFVGAPVNAHASALAQNVGAAYALDTAVKDWAGVLKWEDATKWSIPVANQGVVTPVSNLPFAFTTGDKIRGACWYRPA